ncbi:MAG: shikimate dehydrogenase [Actinomycetales bacterium]|nr:shikimate dehydrogenase [Actinomycetales bacterium]
MARGEPVGTPGRCRAAVLGSPIAHSLSPVLHRAAYTALGLTGWSYEAVEVDEAGLAGWLAGLDHRAERGWAGLSLTMPLKRAVIPLLTEISELAVAVGAVNTVVFASGPGDGPSGDGVLLRGENTDVHGVVAALAEAGVAEVGCGAILGAGATAASAVAALVRLGCRRPVVYARSAARAQAAVTAGARLGADVRLAPLASFPGSGLAGGPDAGGNGAGAAGNGTPQVVISTLPGGAAGSLLGQDLDAALAGSRPVLLDVVYAPWPTPLAEAWGRAGAPVVGGFTMLLHQAVAQVELMTGRQAPVEVMRAALSAELARRTATPSG